MADPLLTISDLSIGFKEDLVRNISLEVHSGEIIAVLGPSGIGKQLLFEPLQAWFVHDKVRLNSIFQHRVVWATFLNDLVWFATRAFITM